MKKTDTAGARWWNWIIIRLKYNSAEQIRSIKIIELRHSDKLPYARHANAIVDQSIPDRGGLSPFHEHFVVGLEQLHFLDGDVIVKEIFHLALVLLFFSLLKAEIGFHVSQAQLKPHSERHTPHDEYGEQFESCSILIKKFQSSSERENENENNWNSFCTAKRRLEQCAKLKASKRTNLAREQFCYALRTKLKQTLKEISRFSLRFF